MKFPFVLPIMFVIGCAPVPSTAYRDEFMGYDYQQRQMGDEGISGLSRNEVEDRIERAYLDGDLTAAQAWKAHLSLDVKGHETTEQMRVIYREREAKRDAYESSEENLDVVRDTARTGASVASSLESVARSLRAITAGR